ncbi:MAG: serine hydrolase [Woeseiaceae bacterium]
MNDSRRSWRLSAPKSGACRDARVLLAGMLVLGMTACSKPYTWDGSLEALLESQPEHFRVVLEDPARYRVQILYTQIDRDADNRPSFRSFAYRLNPDEYFYPASTVKLPTAAVALEKLRALDVAGLDRDTEMLVGGEEEGKSVGRYVREVLLVSDNQAFNRLYDFVGQEPLNQRLHALGLDGTRIMHRLSIVLDVEENRRTGPVRFVDDGAVLYEQEAAYSATDYTASEPILLGKAEIIGGERHERPKDFSTKNAYPLQAQHDVIKALMFPDAVAKNMRFDLADDDYAFLYRNMSGYPGDSGIEEYADRETYPEGYVKFLVYGGDAPDIPDNVRIFNKVGDAYGFLTDAAYIVDFDNGVEFILAATIFTNANETFNDDNYEYDEIALPFMRNLGKAIYEIELQRERPHAPDLGRFRVARD